MTLSQVLLITSVVYNFIVDKNAKVGLHVKQNKHVIFLPSQFTNHQNSRVKNAWFNGRKEGVMRIGRKRRSDKRGKREEGRQEEREKSKQETYVSKSLHSD